MDVVLDEGRHRSRRRECGESNPHRSLVGLEIRAESSHTSVGKQA